MLYAAIISRATRKESIITALWNKAIQKKTLNMDNYDDGYKPRDLAEALSGCLVMIGFFILALLICAALNMCSHG